MPFFLPLYETNLNFIFIKRVLHPQYTLYDKHNETTNFRKHIKKEYVFVSIEKCREVAKERLALLHFKSNFGKTKIARWFCYS